MSDPSSHVSAPDSRVFQSAAIVVMLSIAFAVLATVLSLAAFAASGSEMLFRVLITVYLAVSIPALLWRKVNAVAIGIDLFTWTETIVNAVIYAVTVYGAVRLLGARIVSKTIRRIVYGGLAAALVVLAYVLEGYAA